MGHWFALGWRALELAVLYLAVCVVAGFGYPLYRRLVVMWTEGRGWHDAGVVLRVRSRKGKADRPTSHRRRPEPVLQPLAIAPAARMVRRDDTLLSETVTIERLGSDG